MAENQLSIVTPPMLRWGDFIQQNQAYVTAKPWQEEDGVTYVPIRLGDGGPDLVARYTDPGQALVVERP